MLFSKNEEITLANFKRWADNKSVINVKVDDNWVKAEAEDKNGPCLNLRIKPEYCHLVWSDLVVLLPWSENFYE